MLVRRFILFFTYCLSFYNVTFAEQSVVLNSDLTANSVSEILAYLQKQQESLEIVETNNNSANKVKDVLSHVYEQRINELSQSDLEQFKHAVEWAIYSGMLEEKLSNWSTFKSTLQTIQLQTDSTDFTIAASASLQARREVLLRVLSLYKSLDAARLKTLIDQKRLPSMTDILGNFTTYNSSSVDNSEMLEGLIADLAFDRLDDDAAQLRDSNNRVVTNTSLIDPTYSWRMSSTNKDTANQDNSIFGLLMLAKNVFSDTTKFSTKNGLGVNPEYVSKAVSAWMQVLNDKITFADHVNSLIRVIERNNITSASVLQSRVSRLITAYDKTATADLKNKASSAIENFVINNKYKRSDFEPYILALKRDVFASQVLKDNDKFVLVWSDGQTQKVVCCQPGQTGTSSSASYTAKVCIDSLTQPRAMLTAYLYDNKVKICFEEGENKYSLNSGTGLFEKEATTNAAAYLFYVVGDANKLSLQAESLAAGQVGGLVTVGLDNNLSTNNLVTNTPLIQLDAQGKIVQSQRNTFQLIPVSTTMQALAVVRKSLNVADLDAKISGINSGTVSGILANYQKIMLTAFAASQDDWLVFIKEMNWLLDILSKTNNKAAFDEVKKVRSALEDIVKYIQTSASQTTSFSDRLKTELDNLNKRWQGFWNQVFVGDLPEAVFVPEDQDVISIYSSDLILQTEQIRDEMGVVSYYAKFAANSPADRRTQFLVHRVNGVFTFESIFFPGYYLSVYDQDLKNVASDSTWVRSKRICLIQQSTADQAVAALPDALKFVFEANSSNKLVLKTQLSFDRLKANLFKTGVFTSDMLYVGRGQGQTTASATTNATSTTSYDDSLNKDYAVVGVAKNAATTLSLKPVSTFYRALSQLQIQTDDLVRMQGDGQVTGFLGLLDFVGSNTDLKDLIFELNSFIDTKQSTPEAWQKFLVNANLVNAWNKIGEKLDKMVKLQAFMQSASLLNDLRENYKRGYVDDLASVLNKQYSLRWTDNKGQARYLVSKENNSLSFDQTNMFGVQNLVNLEEVAAQPGKNLYYLKFGQKYLLETATLGTSETGRAVVFLSGTLDAFSLRLISDKSKNPQYLSVSTTQALEWQDGYLQSNVYIPFTQKQIFALELYNDFDLNLLNAYKACDLSDGTLIDDPNLETKLSNRLNFYQVGLEQLKASQFSPSDLVMYGQQIYNFMVDLTTRLEGEAYFTLVENPGLVSLFEDRIITALAKYTKDHAGDLGTPKASLDSQMQAMVQMWQDGFVEGGLVGDGQVFVLEVQPTSGSDSVFLKVKEDVVQSLHYYNLQAATNMYDPAAQFVATVFKDRVAIGCQTAAVKDQYLKIYNLQAKNPSIADRRLTFSALAIDKSGQKINIRSEAASDYHFKFEYDGATNNCFMSNVAHGLLAGSPSKAKVVVDNSDQNFVTSVIDPKENYPQRFVVRVLSALHLKLTDMIQETDLTKQFSILAQILQEKYLNANNAADFVSQFKVFLKSLKSDPIKIKAYSAAPDLAKQMDKIFTLLAEQKAMLSATAANAEAIYNQLTSFAQGRFAQSLQDFDQKIVKFGYKDNLDRMLWAERLTETDSKGKIALSSKLVLQENSLVGGLMCKLTNVTTENNSVVLPKLALYFQSSDSKAYPLVVSTTNSLSSGAASNSRDLLVSSNLNDAPTLFDTEGFSDQLSLRYASGTTTYYLTASVVQNQVQLRLEPGIAGLNKKIGPSQTNQVFQMTQVSDVEQVLYLINKETKDSNRLSMLLELANSLNGQTVATQDLTLLFSQVNQFVLSKTVSAASYQIASKDSEISNLLNLLFQELEKLVGSDTNLSEQLDEILAGWEEGFAGSLYAGAPKNGDVILISDALSRKFLQLTNYVVSGQTTTCIAAINDDYLNSLSHFKVSTYKNRYMFESVQRPGFFLSVLYQATDKNLSDEKKRIGLLPKIKDAAGKDLLASNKQMSYCQFTLEPQSGASSAEQQFTLVSLLDNQKIILEDDDQGFLRSEKFALVGPDYGDEPQFNDRFVFKFLTKLDQQLVQMRALSTEKQKFDALVQILAQRYVYDEPTAKAYLDACVTYLQTKKTSYQVWQDFRANPEVQAGLTQLFSAIKADAFASKYMANIEKEINQGFSQQMPKDGYVRLRWQAPDGQMLAIKAAELTQDKQTSTMQLYDESNPDRNTLIQLDSGITLKTLAAANTNAFDPDSVFKVVYVDDSQFALLWTKSQVSYVVKINDDPANQSQKRNIITLDPAVGKQDQAEPYGLYQLVDKNLVLHDASKLKPYLFTNLGAFENMEFVSQLTGSLLSVGKVDNYLSTYSDIDDQPAGIIVGGEQTASAYEQFKVETLPAHVQILSEVLSYKTIGDVLLGLLNFPTLYSRAVGGLALKNNLADKQIYLDAIEFFVNQIVTSEVKAQQIKVDTTNSNNVLMTRLVQSMAQLALTPDQTQKITSLAGMWNRGYVGKPNLQAPNNDQAFVWYVGKYTKATVSATGEVEEAVDAWGSDSGKPTIAQAASATTDQNASAGIEPLLLAAIYNQSLSKTVLTAVGWDNSFEASIRTSLSLTDKGEITPEAYFANYYRVTDKYLLDADPFATRSDLSAVVAGQAFGVKTAQQMLSLKPLAKLTALNLAATKEPVAYFDLDAFSKSYDNNPQQFRVEGDSFDALKIYVPLVKGYLKLQSDGSLQAYAYTQGKANAANTYSAVPVKSDEALSFTMLKYSALMQKLKSIRAIDDNKAKFNAYTEAFSLVGSDWDLKLLVDDVVRFIAKYRKTSLDWTNFLKLTSLVDALAQLIGKIQTTFDAQSSSEVKFSLDQKQKDMLNWQLMCLRGEFSPSFLYEQKAEEKVLDFDQTFKALVSRLPNLSASALEAYIQEWQKLLLRRVELDLDNTNVAPAKNFNYAQQDVADFIDYQLSEHKLIQNASLGDKIFSLAERALKDSGKTGQKILDAAEKILKGSEVSEKVLDMADQFSADFRYEELPTNLNFMLDNYPVFSIDRVKLFLQQLVKSTSATALTKAQAVLYDLGVIKRIISRAMANQLSTFLAQNIDTFIKDAKLEPGKTLRESLLSFVNTLKYPVPLGKNFTDYVTKLVGLINTVDTLDADRLRYTNLLLDVLADWAIAFPNDYKTEVWISLLNLPANTQAAAINKTTKEVYRKSQRSQVVAKLNQLLSGDYSDWLETQAVKSKISDYAAAISPIVTAVNTATATATTTTPATSTSSAAATSTVAGFKRAATPTLVS